MTSTAIDTSLVTFKAISTFSSSLEEIFGKRQRPLKLYVRLLTRTTLSHEKAIKKHIEAFREFCTANREALETKDAKKLVKNKIIYSERVYIDMSRIFSAADKETTNIIWEHLLTIAALVDPTGKARQILKESAKKGNSATEANFLTDIIGKVEKHVDPEADPMQAVASIMQSGVFADLVGGMGSGLQDGSLDLGKLMGTVQSMVSNLSEGATDAKQWDTADLLGSMMGSLKAGASDAPSGGVPDLSGVLNMMGPMLGALSATSGPTSGGSGNISEKIDAKVAAARERGDLPHKKVEPSKQPSK